METLFLPTGVLLYPIRHPINVPNLDKLVHVFLFATFVSTMVLFTSTARKIPKALKIIFFGIYLFAAFNGRFK